MSKTSLRSKSSLRSSSKRGKKKEEGNLGLKPYGFCCSRDHYDPLTKYDQRNPPFRSSMIDMTQPIDGSPSLKVRVEYIESKNMIPSRKDLKSKGGNIDGYLGADTSCSPSHGPLLWYREEEIQLAKDMVWQEKQKIAKEKAIRNAEIGKRRIKTIIYRTKNLNAPRWYQDFSIKQMQNLLSLKNTLLVDYEENVTGRTERALSAIGITLTFAKISSTTIRKLRLAAKLDPIAFLCQIYRQLTGKHFEDEDYKKSYDCNERIVLSAIAFLALPETIIELNKRMPPVKMPKFPSKPQLQKIRASRCHWRSPYLEPLWTMLDWTEHRSRLEQWHKKCKKIPIPKVILPPVKNDLVVNEGTAMIRKRVGERRDILTDNRESINIQDNARKLYHVDELDEEQTIEQKTIASIKNDKDASMDFKILRLPEGSNQKFDFTISGLGGQPGPVDYKLCGTLRSPLPRRKSWFGEKEVHYVISGISEHEDPPKCPVTFVMNGVAYVTPDDSSEDFFAELKLGDGPKKIYPSGRKNLSRKWQEWLEDADEEFRKLEKEANKLIKSVEGTMRLVIPGSTCDACCSCRQTRKADQKRHETKLPYMVIDSIAEGDDHNKYIVGSLAMHSPAPSPPESTVNLLEIIASRDDVSKKFVINGITNDSGETIYYISGIVQETDHVSSKNISKSLPLKPLKNVPPCACAIQQIFNDDLSPGSSKDDHSKTNKQKSCIGKKYRPYEVPAYSCIEFLNDESYKVSSSTGATKGMKKIGKGKMTTERQDVRQKSRTVLASKSYDDDEEKAISGTFWDDRMQNSRPPGMIESGWRKTMKLNRAELYHQRSKGEEIMKVQENQVTKDSNCKCYDQQNVLGTDSSKVVGRTDYEKSLPCRQQQVSVTNGKGTRRNREFDNNKNKKTRIVSVKSKGDRTYKEGTLKINVEEPRFRDKFNLVRNRPKNSKAFVKSIKRNNFKNKNDEDQKDKEIRGLKNKIRIDKTKDSQRDYSSREREVRGLIKNNDRRWSKKKEKLKKSYKENNNDDVRKNDKSKHTREEKKKEVKVNKKDDKENITKKIKEKMEKVKKLTSSEANFTKKEPISGIPNVIKQKQQKSLKHVEPISVPKESSKVSKREHDESKTLETANQNAANEPPKEGPFGWKTKSEQDLPSEKTLIYLVEPTYPIEMVPLRPGGRACHCRQNRNSKKILLYGIGGITNQGRGTKNQNLARVIEGVTYVTPTPSPRVSDEFVPEYELSDPPYDVCLTNQRKDSTMKYVEQFLGPNSLISNKPQNTESCRCDDKNTHDVNEDDYTEDEDRFEEAKNENTREISTMNKISKNGSGSIIFDVNSKSPEPFINQGTTAFKYENLTDFYAHSQENVPFKVRCAKFIKDSCHTKLRKLQIKKPICECKYERKLLRREEEKKKWLERQQRLKSCKKQPFLHVTGTSRPVKSDIKLVISAVKRIPRKDEYKDDVQYCISGVVENRSMGPAQSLLSGVAMHTPFVTPESSKPKISCTCGHRHWSPMNVTTDGTFTRTNPYPCRKRIKGIEVSTDFVNEDVSQSICHSYPNATLCNSSPELFDMEPRVPGAKMNRFSGVLLEKEIMVKDTNGSKRCSRKDRWSRTQDFMRVIKKMNDDQFDSSKRTTDTLNAGSIKNFVNEMQCDVIESNSKINKSAATNLTIQDRGDGDKMQRSKNWGSETNLMRIMKLELEKMASEGFLLAKLPAICKMPQLKTWIMYRKGVTYTENDKIKILDNFNNKWNTLCSMKHNYLKFAPISLDMTKKKIKSLTYDRANEIKRKIAMKKAIFFSKVRKRRVSRTRIMWNLMEFGKFPCMPFKQAFFTYLPSKEADGHVFRPWQNTEIRKHN